tara:strand:- start:1428 stop:1850 length:423 start_codon:yes stop_codon:yes gene_type:complete
MNKSNNETLTVLSECTSTVKVSWEDSRPFIHNDDVHKILGWELKPEGLCREETCIPVSNLPDSVESETVDLLTLTEVLEFSTVIDREAGFLAIDSFSSLRTSALLERKAPDICLPDLTGDKRFLSEWSDKKKLLVAFSTW